MVRALEGSEAWVEVRQGGCGRCHEEGGCGGHHLTQIFCSSPKNYRVLNADGVSVGDEVTIGVPARTLVASANLAYVLPLAMAIGGALLGMSLSGDGGAMLGGGFGLLLAWGIVRREMQRKSGNWDFQPKILPD